MGDIMEEKTGIIKWISYEKFGIMFEGTSWFDYKNEDINNFHKGDSVKYKHEGKLIHEIGIIKQKIEGKLKELSYLFQIQDKPLEASDLEIIEWHNIATKLQKELAQLIIEAQFRISLKL